MFLWKYTKVTQLNFYRSQIQNILEKTFKFLIRPFSNTFFQRFLKCNTKKTFQTQLIMKNLSFIYLLQQFCVSRYFWSDTLFDEISDVIYWSPSRFGSQRLRCVHPEAIIRWFGLNWTHWTGPTCPPLRTQILKPVSAFQMWIRPSVEPDKTNWKVKQIKDVKVLCYLNFFFFFGEQTFIFFLN